MAHAQKLDFVFRRNGRVYLNRQGCQFSRLLAAEVCASAVVLLDTPCSEIVWRVMATHSIRQFPLHFPSRASPCAITFKLDSTTKHLTLWTRCSINWCRYNGVSLYAKDTGNWITWKTVIIRYAKVKEFERYCSFSGTMATCVWYEWVETSVWVGQSAVVIGTSYRQDNYHTVCI